VLILSGQKSIGQDKCIRNHFAAYAKGKGLEGLFARRKGFCECFFKVLAGVMDIWVDRQIGVSRIATMQGRHHQGRTQESDLRSCLLFVKIAHIVIDRRPAWCLEGRER